MATQVCPDQHKCRNGSRCVPHPDFDGAYTCDCQTGQGVYAGFSCDHMATTYCNKENSINSESFCTNGGVCLQSIDDTGYHSGCACPDGYKGDYCEFIENQNVPDYLTAPANGKAGALASPGTTSSGKNNTPLVASMTALAAVVATAFLVYLFVLVKRRRNGEIHTQTSIRQADSAALDADGEVLRNSYAAESGEMYSSPANSQESISRRKFDTDVDVTEQVEGGDDDY